MQHNLIMNTGTHHRTCNLCEAMCGIEIKIEKGAIVSIAGDKEDAFSRGHICPKAVALQDLYSDPDRLRYPLRRTPSGWEQIGWKEALDETAGRIRSIQQKYGNNAVAFYQGNPSVHNYGAILFGAEFSRALRSRNRFSATSVDQLPHHFAAFFMFGHQLLLPVPDIDRTDYLLIIGANPVVSNGSLMSAPDVANRLREIRERGGKVTVIDPRRTETAAIADHHEFIRPGTDVLFLLSLVHVIFAEGLYQPRRLADFTDGLETVRELANDFPPEKVTLATSIAAKRIRSIAREFANAAKAVCYGRLGVCTQQFGAAGLWLVNVLNVVTGNLDREGGAMFTTPAFDIVDLGTKLGLKGHRGRWSSRVRNLPEFAGELPVAVLAEEIQNKGPGQIRGLVTSAGNPVLSTPNGKQLDRALPELEFIVSIDFYLNETTRHADIILPPTTALEHDNYEIAFHLLAIRNTAKYSPGLFRPETGAKHDWEILLELQTRLRSKGLPETIKAKAKKWFLRKIGGPKGILAHGLRTGPYGTGYKPFGNGLNMRKLEEYPHGIDLGPLKSRLPNLLAHQPKRIQLAPEILVSDVPRIRKFLEDFNQQSVNGFDLLLIGRRQLHSNNSWMHNTPRLMRGKDRCTLLIHPLDAADRNIVSGQSVRIRSRAGQVDVSASLSEEMMRGVVSLPHGWGHNLAGIRLSVAEQRPGVSANDLTDDKFVDPISGTAALNGVPVRIETISRDDATMR